MRVGMYVYACVCLREGEKEKEKKERVRGGDKGTGKVSTYMFGDVLGIMGQFVIVKIMCVCVCDEKRGRERCLLLTSRFECKIKTSAGTKLSGPAQSSLT